MRYWDNRRSAWDRGTARGRRPEPTCGLSQEPAHPYGPRVFKWTASLQMDRESSNSHSGSSTLLRRPRSPCNRPGGSGSPALPAYETVPYDALASRGPAGPPLNAFWGRQARRWSGRRALVRCSFPSPVCAPAAASSPYVSTSASGIWQAPSIVKSLRA